MVDAFKLFIAAGAAWFLLRTAQNRAMSEYMAYDESCGIWCSEWITYARLLLFISLPILLLIVGIQRRQKKEVA